MGTSEQVMPFTLLTPGKGMSLHPVKSVTFENLKRLKSYYLNVKALPLPSTVRMHVMYVCMHVYMYAHKEVSWCITSYKLK